MYNWLEFNYNDINDLDEHIKSLLSTFKISDTFYNVYKSGWDVLVHHLDTVTGSLPNCSASHLPV